jgi:hypothetical protein
MTTTTAPLTTTGTSPHHTQHKPKYHEGDNHNADRDRDGERHGKVAREDRSRTNTPRTGAPPTMTQDNAPRMTPRMKGSTWATMHPG